MNARNVAFLLAAMVAAMITAGCPSVTVRSGTGTGDTSEVTVTQDRVEVRVKSPGDPAGPKAGSASTAPSTPSHKSLAREQQDDGARIAAEHQIQRQQLLDAIAALRTQKETAAREISGLEGQRSEAERLQHEATERLEQLKKGIIAGEQKRAELLKGVTEIADRSEGDGKVLQRLQAQIVQATDDLNVLEKQVGEAQMNRDNLASEAKTLKQEVEEQQGKVKAATTQMAAAEASVTNLRKEQELAVTKLLSVQREAAEGQKRLSAASNSRPARGEAATAMKGNPSTAPAAGVTAQDPKTTRDEAVVHTGASNRSWVSWAVSGAVAVVGLVIVALLVTRIRRGLMAVELTHTCGNGSEAFRVVVHPRTEDILLANKGPESVAANGGNEARPRVSVSRLGRLLLLPGQHDEDMAVNGASIGADKVGLHVGDRIEMGSLNQRETWVIEAVERAEVGEEFEPTAAQAA